MVCALQGASPTGAHYTTARAQQLLNAEEARYGLPLTPPRDPRAPVVAFDHARADEYPQGCNGYVVPVSEVGKCALVMHCALRSRNAPCNTEHHWPVVQWHATGRCHKRHAKRLQSPTVHAPANCDVMRLFSD